MNTAAPPFPKDLWNGQSRTHAIKERNVRSPSGYGQDAFPVHERIRISESISRPVLTLQRISTGYPVSVLREKSMCTPGSGLTKKRLGGLSHHPYILVRVLAPAQYFPQPAAKALRRIQHRLRPLALFEGQRIPSVESIVATESCPHILHSSWKNRNPLLSNSLPPPQPTDQNTH